MGDRACWLDEVCPDCGRLVGDGPEAIEHAPACPRSREAEVPDDGEAGS